MGKILRNITMDGTRFRLDINLQDLSMISIAAKLWDSQDIKNRIKDYFSGREYLNREYPDENWCEISKHVVQYSNSINLPPSLSVLLKNTILLVGQKIYDWILYVTKILKLDLISTQKIYFGFGVVDEIKIFDLYWRDLMTRGTFYNSYYFRHSPLFSLACIYGCDKFVKERKNEMLDELSKFYPQIKEGDEIHNIMSVSICMTAGKCFRRNVRSPKRMFEMCLETGFSKAARFYWEKLDKVEKVSNLTNFAMKCWRKYNYPSFLMEKNCENLLFLINQMGKEEMYVFFSDCADEIIRLFLPIWPYQELIVNLLKYDWNIESSRLWKMGDFLISFSKSMNRLELPLDNELLFEIMQKAWRNMSVDEKLCFLMHNASPPLYSVFLTFNPHILNLVLNDPSITEIEGGKIDYFIKEGFVELVKEGKFDFLNEIIETFFNFIPEPKEFLSDQLSNSWFVLDLIKNDESFGLLDQFLDWLAESDAERARLKIEINTISICRSLTESQHRLFKFEVADKFLKWRLETDTEVKSFKEEMKSYNFVFVVHSEYVRIKSGDLSCLRPGHSLAIHPDYYAFNNADGLTFLKFEEATELNRGVVLGVKSSCSGAHFDFVGPDGSLCERWRVEYVGTKVDDYVVLAVREIWSNKYDSSCILTEFINSSNALIKFYYDTDEEVINFKKTKLHVLVTENLIEFLLHAFDSLLFVRENFLDAFCEFCMIPWEKVEEIKLQQQSEIEKFLDTYLIDERNYLFAYTYLNCLFGKVKKTELAKKYMNSSNKAALMCVPYLKQWGEVSPFCGFFHVICIWLNFVDDMKKLKNDVFALYGNTPEWFPALLEESANCDVDSNLVWAW